MELSQDFPGDVSRRLSRLSALHPDSPLHLSHKPSSASLSPAPSSPMTPALSIKGHARLSSAPNLASSPSVRESMDSYLSKRPLTCLTEDPEEKDPNMVELTAESTQSSFQFDEFPTFHRHDADAERCDNDYDWEQLEYEQPPFVISPAKRRQSDRPASGVLGSKLVQRFPSISRRFRSMSEKRTSSLVDAIPDLSGSRSRSRADSMRSILTRESVDNVDMRAASCLASPAPSFIQEEPADGDVVAPLVNDSSESPEEVAAVEDEVPNSLARTPLLPPVLAIRPEVASHVQSPLQSPKVVETPTSPSSPMFTPQYAGLPSPPLSSKASVASFHHRPIVPSAEIPVMVLAEPQDEWAIKLGHANFTIEPEPYLPDQSTAESCRKLKADWEEAERSFGQHLARTRAVYSSTSKVAQLTEEKWASINDVWKAYHKQVLANIKGSAAPEDSADLSRRPSLHFPSHLVGGKFPTFGEKGIVGPMEVVQPVARYSERSYHQRTPSRKRAFWKFIQDLLPSALVKSQA